VVKEGDGRRDGRSKGGVKEIRPDAARTKREGVERERNRKEGMREKKGRKEREGKAFGGGQRK